MTTLAAPLRIEAPPVQPAPPVFLPAVDVQDMPPHAQFGLSYLSWICTDGGFGAWAVCGTDVDGIDVDDEKEFAGPDVRTGYPFTVYAGVTCDLLGRPYGAIARMRLELAEDVTVGKAFHDIAMANLPVAPAVSAADITEAVAMAEGLVGSEFLGAAVIHMSRYLATLAFGAQVLFPDSLGGPVRTGLGTPVAISAAWGDDGIAVSGPIHLWRGPIAVVDTDDRQANQAIAIAERSYVVATDCTPVLITITGS